MSGFIASGTTSAVHPITQAGFWPDLDGAHLRAAMRLTAAVTDARLEVAAVNAMIEANRELDLYRRARIEEGHATLADVPATEINGASNLLHLYRRIIYSNATAELIERYQGYDATNSGEQKASEEESSPDQLRRDARKALRTILGISHATVESL